MILNLVKIIFPDSCTFFPFLHLSNISDMNVGYISLFGADI